MKKLCPFKKKTFYDNRVFGQGHPAPVVAEEEFGECVEEMCGVWDERRGQCSFNKTTQPILSQKEIDELNETVALSNDFINMLAGEK